MKKMRFRAVTVVLGAVLFAVMILWLVLALGNASRASESERLAQVKQAVENGITLCYATEGAYPESLEYLTQSYGVVYDESRYLVHYERFAANVRPAVTVIRRES
ncbi:MAG: hypothetical protein SPD47_10960 [Oscillospiraceae bacterium]|nr:hypothetical protein [Oscillospiraceae bacterium]